MTSARSPTPDDAKQAGSPPSMYAAPLSPVVSTGADVDRHEAANIVRAQAIGDFSSFDAMVQSHMSGFHARYPARKLRRDALPVMAGDPTTGRMGVRTEDRIQEDNVSGFFPLVVIPGMPPAAYPEYIGILGRCTIAACATRSAAHADVVSDRFMQQLAFMVTAVRCGTWAAIQHVPYGNVAPCSGALTYQSDQSRAVRKPLTAVAHLGDWYVAFDRVQPASANMLELGHWLAHLAPIMLGMRCVVRENTSEAFTVPYVQQAVMRHLRAKLPRNVVALANLGKPIVWEALMMAAAHGLPAAALHAWSTDRVFQIQAQRRLMSSETELAASRRQEKAAVESAADVEVDYDASSVVGVESGLTRAARAAESRTRDDDLGSVIGDFELEDDAQANATYGHSPPARSVASTPPSDMTAARAQQIRDAVAHAASMGPRAASEMQAADPNQPVEW